MSTIAQNTLDLQALLELANSLPDAGGGSADPVLQPLTVTPSENVQNFSPNGFDGYSSVKVNAINNTFVGTGVTRQAAQTITPGTSNKTIASGRYLTGVQTILGDADLVAGNIKKGVTIFDVLGTYEGSGGGLPSGISKLATGSFTPSSDISSVQTITHGLGVMPDFIMTFADTGDIVIGDNSDFAGYFLRASSVAIKMKYNSNTYPYLSEQGYVTTDGTIRVALSYMHQSSITSDIFMLMASSSHKLKSGVTYHWVACAFE